MFLDGYLLYYILGILILPGIILGIVAQAKVQSTFNKYSDINSRGGMRASDVARRVLDSEGLEKIDLRHVNGSLTDHYHPTKKYIGLSDDIFNSTSVAAIGVALHEVGHAIQDRDKYPFLKVRQAMIPVTNIASTLLWPLVIIGIILGFGTGYGGIWGEIFVYSGVGFYGLSTLLSLITLPVEFDASRRALKAIEERNILDEEEYGMAKKVLVAAAMTYVASFVVSLLYFLRFLLFVFLSRER